MWKALIWRLLLLSVAISAAVLIFLVAIPSSSDPAGATTYQVNSLRASPADEVFVGQTITVSADIANKGKEQTVFPVRFIVNGRVENTSPERLDPGKSRTVTFSYKADAPGVYNFTVGRKSASVQVYGPATFKTRCLTVTPESVRAGQTADVAVAVSKFGDVSGTYKATLQADGTEVSSNSVNMSKSDRQKSAEFTYVPQKPGIVRLAVGTASATLLVTPADRSRVGPPGSLGNVKFFQPSNLQTPRKYQAGNLTNIRGAGFNPKRHSLWVAEPINQDPGTPVQTEAAFYEFEVSGCSQSNPKLLSSFRIPTVGQEGDIEEIDFDSDDDSLYYLNVGGDVTQIDTTGRQLRQFSTRVDHYPTPASPTGAVLGRTGLAVQGDFLWIGNGSGIFKFEKRSGKWTGLVISAAKHGLAYDADRHLLWAGNWGDGTFAAWDPDTLKQVYKSEVFPLPGLTVGADREGGHNLAYGDGCLWFGTQNFDAERIYGIQVQ